MLNHELDELLEGGGHRIPTKFILSLGWIAPEIHHIGRTIEIFRYGYNDLAYKKFRARYYNTFLINAFTFPTKFYTSVMESESSKLTNSMLYTCSNNEIFWLIVLEDKPHTLNIILGIPPITKRR